MTGLALQATTFRSLRDHRNYRLFFSGQVVSVSGTWMQNVALAWLVIQLTHSPLAVGALAFCRFVPFTVFGLLAGVLADRVDNRRLVMATQTASMALSAALAALALSGTATLPLVFGLAILTGIAQVFDAPGRQALTYQLVGSAELPNAVALNSSLFNMSRVVGPAIAGVLIAAVDVGACFLINAFSSSPYSPGCWQCARTSSIRCSAAHGRASEETSPRGSPSRGDRTMSASCS